MNKILLYTIFFLLLFPGILKSESQQSNAIGNDWTVDIPWKIKAEQDFIPVYIGFLYGGIPFGNNKINGLSIYTKAFTDTDFQTTYHYNNKKDVLMAHSTNELNSRPFQLESMDISTEQSLVFHHPKNNKRALRLHADWYIMPFLSKKHIQKIHPNQEYIDIRVVLHIGNEKKSFDFRTQLSAEKELQLTDWYVGDTHFHTAYTRNILEYGMPMKANQIALTSIGMDWSMTTDHSCDFDNHGKGILEVWNNYLSEIKALQSDNACLLIPGIEASLLGEKNKLIHMLVFPPPENVYSLPYIGDGDGDIVKTKYTVNQALALLDCVGGFAYAAHPFAEADKLGIGDIWNIAHPDFPTNEEAMPSIGTVICNDLKYPSDVFSTHPNKVFKSALSGAEIWNVMNSLYTKSFTQEPWTTKAFIPYNDTSVASHENRLRQGMDVMKFLWKTGLKARNTNPQIENFRFYLMGGSDAHGSFNYTNTETWTALYGGLSNNAIGKLKTYAYCQQGMGENGENVIRALENGNSFMSNGPLISFTINHKKNTYQSGDFLSYSDKNNYKLSINALSSEQYGDIISLKILVGTANDEKILLEKNGGKKIKLKENLNDLIKTYISEEKNIYLRVEVKTQRIYSQAEKEIFLRDKESFYAFSNPIWIEFPR
jgi:hypothetical protein